MYSLGRVSQRRAVHRCRSGSSIGVWNAAGEAGHASRVLTTVAARRVRVASIFQLEGVLAGVGPMPAADVLGASWSLLSLGLLFASSGVLLVVLGSVSLKLFRSRSRAGRLAGHLVASKTQAEKH